MLSRYLQVLMTFSLRHTILLLGIVTTILSFSYFGRDTKTYDILLTVGLIIATLSFLAVIFKKDTTNSKLIWTIIVIGAIGLQRLTEPLLIKFSYSIFVRSNNSNLDRINNMLLSKNDDAIMFIPDGNKDALIKFTDTETAELRQLLSGTNISLIQKDNQRIFYRTFRMLDVSQGVYYFYRKYKPDKRFKHISGNWYY
jgi:hypothetical protein